MCLFFQHRQARAQNFHVSTEFVDDKALYACPLLRLQQFHRAVQLGKHAAAVDVAGQQHRRVHQLGQAHIDDVISFQVDLSRAACALDNNDVKLLDQAVVGLQNVGDQGTLVAEILLGRHVAPHLAINDDLAADVAAGLEQNGVHPHVRLHARGLGLHHLGTAHFQAIPGDKAVQRHVLAFEGGSFVAVLGKNTAERRAQQALARTAHRALHHDAFCAAHASTSPMICSSWSFSTAVRTAVRYQAASNPG